MLPAVHDNLQPALDFLNTPFTLPSDIQFELRNNPYIPRPQLAALLSNILQNGRSALILGPSYLGKTTAVCKELAGPKSAGDENASHDSTFILQVDWSVPS